MSEILPVPSLLLAPMAGITDLPFRNLVHRLAGIRVVSEMIGSQEVVQARLSARLRAELGLAEDETVVQIAGRDPYWMAEAARLLCGQGVRRIDINMGCPARKVTSGASGAALMRDLGLAQRILEAVVAASEVPVSLKMRLGWDENEMSGVALAQIAQDAGICLLTVHGRTRCQFFNGVADHGAIGSIVRAVSIPVIANGDISDAKSAKLALAGSGAAGLMVGRAVRGQPWLMAELGAVLQNKPVPALPTKIEKLALIRAHYEAILSFYGVERGMKNARKHLGWYLDNLGGTEKMRRRLLTETNPARVLEIFDAAQFDQALAA